VEFRANVADCAWPCCAEPLPSDKLSIANIPSVSEVTGSTVCVDVTYWAYCALDNEDHQRRINEASLVDRFL
jgi:hypothetical protein